MDLLKVNDGIPSLYCFALRRYWSVLNCKSIILKLHGQLLAICSCAASCICFNSFLYEYIRERSFLNVALWFISDQRDPNWVYCFSKFDFKYNMIFNDHPIRHRICEWSNIHSTDGVSEKRFDWVCVRWCGASGTLNSSIQVPIYCCITSHRCWHFKSTDSIPNWLQHQSTKSCMINT